MKIKELIEKLSTFNPEAEIITFNRTSNRWIKTTGVDNYSIKKVSETYENCGDYAKKQLDHFSKDDITFFF